MGRLWGGDPIYPREIEEFLYSHPAIADAQVVGVQDERYGEELMAWVQLAPGMELTEDQLKEYCKTRLPNSRFPDTSDS